MIPKNIKLFVEGGKKTRFIKGNKSWNYGMAKKYICKTCKNEFKNKSHGRPKYCSPKCKKIGNWGKLVGKWNLGRKLSKERKKQMSKKAKELGLGKNLFIPDIRKKAIENSRRRLIGKPSWNRGGKAPWVIGEKNINWKGGISTESRKERKIFEWLRKEVLKRDDYTCQICWKRGGILHVDHIQRWSDFKNLRFKMENCRTLCQICHYKITFKRPISNESKKWGIKNYFQIGG